MYQILCEDIAVGTVEVKTEGLYYRFICRCTPPDRQVYRISVYDGVNWRNLGICVPDGDGFILNTRLSAKTLKNEDFIFQLVSARKDEIRIPVAANQPFEALDELETARFLNENGQPEIIIDPIPNQQDSDRSQEYLRKSL